ncbi:MAG: MurT ligase domain-containing protein [Acidimicrobiia bacterium]
MTSTPPERFRGRRALRSRVALTAGRAAGWASRATGRGAGAQVSGRVMLRIDPTLIRSLATDKRVLVISATNGKTTTTRLLRAILEAQGEPVASNDTGANLASGIASALARTAPSSFCVLEVDERALPRIYNALRPELLVLGNLSRDQLDRFGEVHTMANAWRAMLDTHPGQVVIANATDPSIAWAAAPANTTWVQLPPGWRDDATTCPQCGALLHFDGPSYTCVTCAWHNPDATIALDEHILTLHHPTAPEGAPRHQQIPLTLSLPGRWNLENAALAIAAATQLGIRPAHAAAAAQTVGAVSGRYTQYSLADGRPARVMLAKNPAGWSEVLEYLRDGDAAIVLTINARAADGKDPSWLWDVPYELLAGKTVAAAGERALDVAVRLRHAGVECTVFEDPLDAAHHLPGRRIEIVASYTQFHALTRRLHRSIIAPSAEEIS